jgi:hypothetical protein
LTPSEGLLRHLLKTFRPPCGSPLELVACKSVLRRDKPARSALPRGKSRRLRPARQHRPSVFMSVSPSLLPAPNSFTSPGDTVEEICQRIGNLLKSLVRSRSHGLISEEEFVTTLLRIEAEEVSPLGFTLTAANTIDDWTVFNIRPTGSAETCASFEYLPETGELRRPGSGPR